MKMTYEQALKKVNGSKPRDNFMLIKFGYSNIVLLSHKDGVAFLNALAQAESLVDDYNKPKRIDEYDRSAVGITMMSWEEYQRIKMSTLLGITPEALKDVENGVVPEEVPA